MGARNSAAVPMAAVRTRLPPRVFSRWRRRRQASTARPDARHRGRLATGAARARAPSHPSSPHWLLCSNQASLPPGRCRRLRRRCSHFILPPFRPCPRRSSLHNLPAVLQLRSLKLHVPVDLTRQCSAHLLSYCGPRSQTSLSLAS
eukprot:2679178-Pleurochrysis_carterae.AAC.2